MLARRTTITIDAIQRLVPALWGKPRIAALLQSWEDEIQVLEDAIFATIDARLLQNATGDVLRVLARIVGQTDFGWSDDDLRAAIRARIRANRSNGLAADVRDVAGLLSGGAACKVQDAAGPLVMVLRWLEPVTVLRAAIRDILKDTRTGGVRLLVTRPINATPFTFRSRVGSNNAALSWGHGSWVETISV